MTIDMRMIEGIPQVGPATENKVALVDIGSNSIRLVIFRAGGRLPHPQFNERDVCRLGEGLAETGVLAKDRVQHALTTLSRFAEIVAASDVDTLKLFATEAVRKARNSDQFINATEAMFNEKIQVLSGDEEAQFAGRGVLSGFRDVDGIVGDLGGGSLELIHIRNMTSVKMQPKSSLACGHLISLSDQQIMDMITAQDWIKNLAGKPFYAVGGTWRAIATAYSTASKKRIDVVHGLTLTPAEMTGIMSAIDEANGEMTGIPPARRSSMRQALKVMTAIINVLDPSGIVFSSYGVREGILYHELSNDIRRIDPLAAGVAEFALITQRYDGLGKSLSHQVMPFLGGLSESKKRLANACCYLADLTWLDHPDYRASLAIEKMLGLSIVGIDHYERAWMAAVLSVRYSGEFPGQSLLRGLLTRQEREEARLVGLVMRMLMSVSGGMPKLLDQITTKEKKKSVKITIPPALFGTETGLINRRITTIEKIGNLKVKVKLNAAD